MLVFASSKFEDHKLSHSNAMFIVFRKGVDTYAASDSFVISIIAERSAIIRSECAARNDGCVIKTVMPTSPLDSDVRSSFNLSNALTTRSLTEAKTAGEYSRHETISKSCISGRKPLASPVKPRITTSFSILKTPSDTG